MKSLPTLRTAGHKESPSLPKKTVHAAAVSPLHVRQLSRSLNDGSLREPTLGMTEECDQAGLGDARLDGP